MIHFKAATFSDAKSIAALVNSAYRGDYSKKGWTTEADILGGQRTDKGKIKEMIRAQHIELAFEDHKLCGCVYLEQKPDAVYLGMLTVEPSIQAQGLGKKLLERSEEWARNLGFEKMVMTVISSRTELIAFYERRGYQFNGKTENFPMNDPRFGVPKVKAITFKVFEKNLSV